MKICFTLTVLLSLFSVAHSQTYVKVIRSSFSSNSRRMIATSDGGWLIAGNTGESVGDLTTHDFFAIKFKAAGAQQWAVRYGTAGVNDEATSAIQTRDGGYLLSGYSTDAAGKQIGALIRIDSAGNKLWSKTFAGTSPLALVSSVQTADGGYLAGGNYTVNGTNRPVIIKLTAAGAVANYIKPSTVATLRKMITADNSDIVLLLDDGTEDISTKHLIVQRVTAAGTVKWSKLINTAYSETGFDLIQTANKDFVITGTNSLDIGYTIYKGTLLRLDGNGNKKWYRAVSSYVTPGSNTINGYQVIEDNDGSLIACGTTLTDKAGSGYDIFLMKCTSSGAFVSTSYIDLPNLSGYDDFGRGIVKAKDGGYLLVSTSQAYGYAATLVKGDSSLNFCVPKVSFTPASQDTAFSLSPLPLSFSAQTGIQATDALSLISGTVTLEGKCSKPTLTAATTSIAETAPAPALKIYPNPAAGVLNLSFTGSRAEKGMVQVYDLAGNRYLQQPVSVAAGENSLRLAVSSLRSGQYKLVLSCGAGVLTTPFYKQ